MMLFILIAPIEVLLFVIVLFPFGMEVYLSTTPWTPIHGDWWVSPFIGYNNYLALVTKDLRYLMSIARTGMFVGIVILAEFFLGLGLATLVARDFKAKNVVFTILLIPMMIVPIVVGYIFYMLFLPTGPINFIISQILGRTFLFAWVATESTAFLVLIITDVWHWTPLMFLILFSGMVALPQNPIRAARVLGASGWQIFWGLKMPMLKAVILLAIAIRAMEAMKFFDEIYIITGGGPGFSTETFSFEVYLQALRYFSLGYSAAQAIIILLITVVLIYFLLRPALRMARE